MKRANHHTQYTESFSGDHKAMEAVREKPGGDSPGFLFLFTTVGHGIPEVIRGIRSLCEVFADKGYSEDILNRAIIDVDEERKGIRLAVEIPEGSKVKITRRVMALVLERTREMTETRGVRS